MIKPKKQITKFFVLANTPCFMPEKTTFNTIASLSSMTRPNPVTEAYNPAHFSSLDKTTEVKTSNLDLSAMRRAFSDIGEISFEKFEKAAEKYITAHLTLKADGSPLNGIAVPNAEQNLSSPSANSFNPSTVNKFEDAIGSFETESFVEDDAKEEVNLLTFPLEKEGRALEKGRDVKERPEASTVFKAGDDDLFALNSIFVAHEKINAVSELKSDDDLGIL